jgi:ABC-type antimicrobial peptide transport system permease subunit
LWGYFMRTLLTVFGVILSGTSVSAATVFTASLSGANETPPVASAATGFITVTLSGDTLSVSEVFSGLGSPSTAAHIHCCGGVGVSEPVALPFNTFPMGVTSGSFTGTFDLTSAAVYTAAFVTASGGTAGGAESALIAGLNSGDTYANIHSMVDPGGEIRGQLAAVPEPTTLFLGGSALAALALLRRPRRS